jgi:putative membrane protein
MLAKFYSGNAIDLKRWWADLPAPYLLAAWTVCMIALPIAKFWGGQAGLVIGLTLSVLAQASLVVTILYQAWGLVRTLLAVIIIGGLSWAVEALGSSTGIPFGVYHYTGLLQPQLAGVPLLIPLAWLMMLPAAWAVASRLAGSHSSWAFVGWSASAMTAWDLFLDPQMVAWGIWAWAEPGGYFGIPWANFLGWLLASALITLVVRPGPLPLAPLLFIYVVTWLLETGGLLFFWGLPGPALAGFAGMGTLIWLVYLKHVQAKP